MTAISTATDGIRKPLEARREQAPGHDGEQCPERRAAPSPSGSSDDADSNTRYITSPALARAAFPAAGRCPAPMRNAHVSNTGWLTG
jgi:hypothetical protein